MPFIPFYNIAKSASAAVVIDATVAAWPALVTGAGLA
eukprot:SAG31_NODE_27826_length_419_cov_1.137500_1_plen_36_part_01